MARVLFIGALLAGVLMLGLGGLHSHAWAAEETKHARVFIPAPAKGKGEQCVADTDFMRRYHMTVLNHQRDDTVHEGIRTKQFSLKGCIACHAVDGPDGKPVTVESPKHFCRECHDYAAVTMDCFQCHASRPDPKETAQVPALPGAQASGKSLQDLQQTLTNYMDAFRSVLDKPRGETSQ